jgi:hypothetical protein
MRAISTALGAAMLLIQWSGWLRGYPPALRLAGWLAGRASHRLPGDRARRPFRQATQTAVVIAPLVVLPVLASSSPPDPAWIDGIYDDADHDDVVVLATSVTGDAGAGLAVDMKPALLPIGEVNCASERPALASPAPTTRSRAPPAD